MDATSVNQQASIQLEREVKSEGGRPRSVQVAESERHMCVCGRAVDGGTSMKQEKK